MPITQEVSTTLNSRDMTRGPTSQLLEPSFPNSSLLPTPKPKLRHNLHSWRYQNLAKISEFWKSHSKCRLWKIWRSILKYLREMFSIPWTRSYKPRQTEKVVGIRIDKLSRLLAQGAQQGISTSVPFPPAKNHQNFKFNHHSRFKLKNSKTHFCPTSKKTRPFSKVSRTNLLIHRPGSRPSTRKVFSPPTKGKTPTSWQAWDLRTQAPTSWTISKTPNYQSKDMITRGIIPRTTNRSFTTKRRHLQDK